MNRDECMCSYNGEKSWFMSMSHVEVFYACFPPNYIVSDVVDWWAAFNGMAV